MCHLTPHDQLVIFYSTVEAVASQRDIYEVLRFVEASLFTVKNENISSPPTVASLFVLVISPSSYKTVRGRDFFGVLLFIFVVINQRNHHVLHFSNLIFTFHFNGVVVLIISSSPKDISQLCFKNATLKRSKDHHSWKANGLKTLLNGDIHLAYFICGRLSFLRKSPRFFRKVTMVGMKLVLWSFLLIQIN